MFELCAPRWHQIAVQVAGTRRTIELKTRRRHILKKGGIFWGIYPLRFSDFGSKLVPIRESPRILTAKEKGAPYGTPCAKYALSMARKRVREVISRQVLRPRERHLLQELRLLGHLRRGRHPREPGRRQGLVVRLDLGNARCPSSPRQQCHQAG